MRWQKPLRLAIAVFVIVFAGIVFVALRRSAPPADPATTPRSDPESIAEVRGGEHSRWSPDGRLRWRVVYESQLTFADGRTVLKEAVVTLPDRDGRSATITGGQMEVVAETGGAGDLNVVKASHGVKMQDEGGLEVTSAEATYDDKAGMLTIPGDVQFARGRMTGSGVGATYDRGRDVLWLLDRARIDVAPDESGGAVHATAGSAGLARQEHYIRLTRDAHLTSDGQTLDADDLTIQLTPDDRYVQTMALRGNSRITGAAGASAAEGMSARDIDLTYAPDGRTLQQARLMEEARVQLGSAETQRTIAARTIDMGIGPDGSTVTSLTATSDVQVDLPQAAENPARRITAAALTSGGPAGLQTATFTGGTTYVELNPAGPATDGRTARSETLVIETEPGLGDVTQADFRGNVRIVDGATLAEGRRAIYKVAGNEFDVIPSTEDPGPPSMVRDERVTVNAVRISFNPATRQLRADTDVRSSLQPSRREPGKAAQGGAPVAAAGGGQLPAILQDDEPVNVTSNRLEYDGAASTGTYSGEARLFQGKTHIQADTIVLDDSSGNLTATGRVRSVMFFEETNAETKKTELVQTTATGDTLVYADAMRLATYTTGPTAKAHIVGTQGDVTGDRIDLFLKEGGGELERAVAEGSVVVREGPRTATGAHLVYTPADETYVMRGRPVQIEEHLPEGCRITEAASATFRRTTVDMQIRSNMVSPATVRPCAPK
jgi:lipopolysaccharide export system protein LptA